MAKGKNEFRGTWHQVVSTGLAKTVQKDPNATIIPSDSRQENAHEFATSILQRLSTGTDRLELAGIIGKGGMGVVRMASQVALGRTVAVKTLPKNALVEIDCIAGL